MSEESLSYEESRFLTRRLFILKGGLVTGFSILSWRLWQLQIDQGEQYSKLSQGNRIRLQAIASPRGIVYDTNGIVLAKNISSFNLAITREDVRDPETVLKKVSHVLKIDYKSLLRQLYKNKYAASYEAVILYQNLTWREVVLLNTYQQEFPGISVEVLPIRYFPLQQSLSHTLGYTRQITREQLKKVDKKKVKSSKFIGQDGIELTYNKYLIGQDGGRQVEVDSAGQVIQTLHTVNPKVGDDIYLSIDSKLQQGVERIMEGTKCAVILQNPNNGAIKALVNKEEFDPNIFSKSIKEQEWYRLKQQKILQNKAIQGIYSPGSTIKMAIAFAALETGLINASSTRLCEGYLRVGKQVAHCWKHSGHGSLTVEQAIKHSCNVFFYHMGLELGISTIHEYLTKLGLGRVTGVDLPYELSGILPSKNWKKSYTGRSWLTGDSLSVAIGQGYLSVTPMQLLHYVSCIANNGYTIPPRIVFAEGIRKHVTNDANFSLPKNLEAPVLLPIDCQQETLRLLRSGMIKAVQEPHGTAGHANSSIVPIAGKTGTTQVIGHKTRNRLIREGKMERKYENHAWFVSFAPSDNPQIAGVVFLENGKAGNVAAKYMKKILEFYFTEIEPYNKKA